MLKNSIIWMKEFLKESNKKIIENIKKNKLPLMDENKLHDFFKELK